MGPGVGVGERRYYQMPTSQWPRKHRTEPPRDAYHNVTPPGCLPHRLSSRFHGLRPVFDPVQRLESSLCVWHLFFPVSWPPTPSISHKGLTPTLTFCPRLQPVSNSSDGIRRESSLFHLHHKGLLFSTTPPRLGCRGHIMVTGGSWVTR
ncbi:hypothetical protein HJG60_010171 [Phyllostomus discolor]|uniref:Uncharacterized protein n=1 Tax=Phyllostomus discolor TaxID=89673 RepID=A0A834AWE8_9CHIR|nr:hypothetical protein HJG60_010171 [Phyllostomus discolor]